MPERDEIEAQVAARFAAVATDPTAERGFAVGRESAASLGYPDDELDRAPPEVVASFAGVGRPLSLGAPEDGETILDLGCGSGLDLLLASRAVGPGGRTFGVDLTPAMLDRARRGLRAAGVRNATLIRARADHLPLRDASVDRVITNGVFNLCVDKAAVLSELHRVLRPGGRLQMADILLEDHVTEVALAKMGAWSA